MKNTITNVFAHLGGSRRAAAKGKAPAAKAEETPSEENEEDDPEAEEDDEQQPEAEDDEEAAEDDEQQPEGEDDPDKEKEAAVRKAYADGYKAANTRASRIFGAEAAAGREGLAATLAFTTNLTSKAAIAVLEATPAGKGGGLASQMSRQPNANLGSGGERNAAAAGSKLVANAKARGEAAKRR